MVIVVAMVATVTMVTAVIEDMVDDMAMLVTAPAIPVSIVLINYPPQLRRLLDGLWRAPKNLLILSHACSGG